MTNRMKTVALTGSQGFIGGYLCRDLLARGYRVIGYDNFSKYGRVKREHDSHENFRLVELDLSKETPDFSTHNPDYVIACAAMIGGISYFHKYAYDLLSTNERILSNTFDASIELWKDKWMKIKKVVVISSSMVFEGADEAWKHLFEASEFWPPWPTPEGAEKVFGPPNSTYGFQKLASEYFCKGAWQQYGLPFTIVRPFNCVGLGEDEAVGEEEIYSGNVKLRMSHVLPDLVNKVLSGQNPLHILGDGSQIRCYTHGKDIARGIRLAMENPLQNEDFNLSSPRQTSVLELAKMVWTRINGELPFRYVSDKPFECDVQKRVPLVNKARDMLGFETEITLEESVDEIVASMLEEKERHEDNCS